MPKHPSVVINLAEDSSDSDAETETESDAPQPMAMLSGLDQFLKDARKSVEVSISYRWDHIIYELRIGLFA